MHCVTPAPSSVDTPALTELATEFEDAFTDLARELLRLGAGELSRTAASVLSRLAHEGPHRVTELATHQAVAQPTMTALVGRLEQQALVSRRPDPVDARAWLIAIPPAGRTAVRDRSARRAAHVAARLRRLDASERAALAAALPVLRRLAEPSPPA
jgi:DNA-binding MarR family transcriptional regulator